MAYFNLFWMPCFIPVINVEEIVIVLVVVVVVPVGLWGWIQFDKSNAFYVATIGEGISFRSRTSFPARHPWCPCPSSTREGGWSRASRPSTGGSCSSGVAPSKPARTTLSFLEYTQHKSWRKQRLSPIMHETFKIKRVFRTRIYF